MATVFLLFYIAIIGIGLLVNNVFNPNITRSRKCGVKALIGIGLIIFSVVMVKIIT